MLKFKNSVRHVRRMAKDLPEGLKDNQTERMLFRFVCDSLHIPYHGAYTVHELRQALFSVRGLQKMRLNDVCDKYGRLRWLRWK